MKSPHDLYGLSKQEQDFRFTLLGLLLIAGIVGLAAVFLRPAPASPPYLTPLDACMAWSKGEGAYRKWSMHAALAWVPGEEATCLLLSPDGYGRVREKVLRCERTQGCRPLP